MNGLERGLRDFVALFETLRMDYAVMGGVAVRIYGIPRATYDIDFTVAVARDGLPSVFHAAEEIGYTVPQPYQTGWVDHVAGMPLVKVRWHAGGKGVDIDIFLAESGFQRELMTRRCLHQVSGRDVWFVSPEDLVLLKLIAARPRDVSDVLDILFVQGRLDEDHLRRWADELHVRDELERVLAEAAAG